jgi:hypothetical protein
MENQSVAVKRLLFQLLAAALFFSCVRARLPLLLAQCKNVLSLFLCLLASSVPSAVWDSLVAGTAGRLQKSRFCFPPPVSLFCITGAARLDTHRFIYKRNAKCCRGVASLYAQSID